VNIFGFSAFTFKVKVQKLLEYLFVTLITVAFFRSLDSGHVSSKFINLGDNAGNTFPVSRRIRYTLKQSGGPINRSPRTETTGWTDPGD